MRPVDLILRAEALALFVAGVLAYLQLNGHPLWLLPLLLAPDLSMIGYVRGARLGAITYNLVHNLPIMDRCTRIRPRSAAEGCSSWGRPRPRRGWLPAPRRSRR